MLTFLISGIWHGAGWNYIAWGFLHGVFQVAERITASFRAKVVRFFGISTENFSHHVFQMGITFLLSTFAWVFFRANSLYLALAYFRQMLHLDFTTYMTSEIPNLLGTSKDIRTLVIGLAILLLVSILRKRGEMLDAFMIRQSMFFRIGVTIVLIVFILKYGTYGSDVYTEPFVYFQF